MRAFRFTAAFVLLASASWQSSFAHGDDAAETAALNRLPTVVRSVKRDDQLPGSPIVELSLGLIYELEFVRNGPVRFRDEDVALLRPFHNLTRLELIGCEITDKGLAKLAALDNLTSLKLAFCDKVTGDGLAALAKLKELKIRYCRGLAHLRVAPLQQLSNLGILGCDKLIGADLNELKELPNLIHFKLLGCRKITDSDLGVVKALHSLRHLDLTFHYEQADAGLTKITDLQSLETLSLHGTLISDAGLADLGRLHNLKSLSLSSSTMTNDGFKVVKAIPRLSDVRLNGCEQITGSGLRVLKELAHLTSLEIDEFYDFTDAELAQIRECRHLKRLVLAGAAREVTPASITGLHDLSALETLALQCYFELDELRPIKTLTKLKFLQIEFPFDRTVSEFRDAESWSAAEVVWKEFLHNFAVREFRDALSSTEIIWREHSLHSSGSWYRESVPRRGSELLPDEFRLPYEWEAIDGL